MFTQERKHRFISMALSALVLSAGVLGVTAFASDEEPAAEDRPVLIETVWDGYTSRQAFEYDDDGNLLQMTTEMDLNGTSDMTTTEYTYADGLVQTVETDTVTDLGDVSFAQSSRTEYSYQDGVLVGAETTDTEDGEVLSVSQIAYTYDDNGLLAEEATTGDDGSFETVSYTYGEAGQLVQVVRSYVNTDYSYDTMEEYENGRMIHETVTGDVLASETQYSYDEHGNFLRITSVQDGVESVSTFENTYDDAGRLTKAVCTITGEDSEPATVQTLSYYYAE